MKVKYTFNINNDDGRPSYRVYIHLLCDDVEKEILPDLNQKITLPSGYIVSLRRGREFGQYYCVLSFPKEDTGQKLDIISLGEHPQLRAMFREWLAMMAKILNKSLEDIPIEESGEIEISPDFQELYAAAKFALEALKNAPKEVYNAGRG